MPGVGIGGLISSALNPSLNDQVARALTPNPAPLAQQGPGGGTADSVGNPSQPAPPPGSNLAPAASTQSDPVNSQYIGTLLKASQQAAYAADLNRNLEGVAAGFGTAQQQASKQAALRGEGGGAGDYLGQLKTMQGMQDQTIQDNEHARFMGNAHVFAQILSQSLGRSVSDAEATEIMNNKGLTDQFGGAAASGVTPTSTSKDFQTAQAAVASQIQSEHPDWTPAQVQKEVNLRVPPALLMSGVGGTLADQEYQQYAAGERAAGRAPLGPVEWSEKQKVSAIGQETQTKQATEFKDTAIQDFNAVHQKLTLSESEVDKLLANMPATMKALQYPNLFTTSGAAATASAFGIGVPDDIKQAALAAQQLVSNLTGESLSSVKNVRNQREFQTLGNAATAGLNANNGEEGVRKALETIKAKFASAHAQAYATAGKVIPNQYAGLADERYTSKTLDGKDNPYYTGATYEPADSKSDNPAPKSDQPPAPDAKKAPDGHWYVPDPARPGKYLRVD